MSCSKKELYHQVGGYIGEVENEDYFTLLIGLTDILNNLKGAMEVMAKEEYCNFYSEIDNYYELSKAMINDDCLWEDSDTESDEFYQFLYDECSEEVLKERLLKSGWYISEYGLAVLLGDDIINKYMNNIENKF